MKIKNYDIVTSFNLKPKYKDSNLYINVNGIVLKALPNNQNLVLFLNDKIIGDHAVVEVVFYKIRLVMITKKIID